MTRLFDVCVIKVPSILETFNTGRIQCCESGTPVLDLNGFPPKSKRNFDNAREHPHAPHAYLLCILILWLSQRSVVACCAICVAAHPSVEHSITGGHHPPRRAACCPPCSQDRSHSSMPEMPPRPRAMAQPGDCCSATDPAPDGQWDRFAPDCAHHEAHKTVRCLICDCLLAYLPAPHPLDRAVALSGAGYLESVWEAAEEEQVPAACRAVLPLARLVIFQSHTL